MLPAGLCVRKRIVQVLDSLECCGDVPGWTVPTLCHCCMC